MPSETVALHLNGAETSAEALRRQKLRDRFEAIKVKMRTNPNRERRAHGEELICLTYLATGMVNNLPPRVRYMAITAGASLYQEAQIEFNHFSEYAPHAPSYSMIVSWERPQGEGAKISDLIINVNEQTPDQLKQFFPLDSKTKYRSDGHFPYPDSFPASLIPQEDLPAHKLDQDLRFLMSKDRFALGVLEELTEIFMEK